MEVVAAHQRLLEAVDALQLADQVFQRAPRQDRVGVLEQLLEHAVVAVIDDRLGDLGAQRRTQRNDQQMFLAAVLDDLDQVGIAQQPAAAQDRLGHRGVVVGEEQQQLARRRVHLRQAGCQRAAHLHLHLVHEAAENLDHQRALAVAQAPVARQEQIVDVVEKDAPALLRLTLRKADQIAENRHLELRNPVRHVAYLSLTPTAGAPLRTRTSKLPNATLF